MTVWKLIKDCYKNNGLLWLVCVFFVVGFFYILAHPEIIEEWNVIINTKIAKFAPKRRKKTYEKRINLTVHSARRKFNKAAPEHVKKLLPYDLKIEWIGDKHSVDSIVKDKQVVMYVPSYIDESKQIVGILHNYCTKGFAERAKIYMSERTKDASDLVMTRKLCQMSGNHVFDYYNRNYLPEILMTNPNYRTAYDNICKIDTDGLFLPIFINEIDKFANGIYPSDPSDEINEIITNFSNFILKIVEKNKEERVDTLFSQGGLHIRIIMAVSDSNKDIKPIIKAAETDISNHRINTFYVLATGQKIPYAKLISKELYESNPQDLYQPKESNYKRFTHSLNGSDSICIEIDCVD